MEQLQTEALSQISVQDIERYLEDHKYRPNDPEHKNMNREQGIKRKFFSLKSFFGYLCRVGTFNLVNQTLSCRYGLVQGRPTHSEMKELLAEVDSGSGCRADRKRFMNGPDSRQRSPPALMHAGNRDPRLSECVGLNLDKCDMKKRDPYPQKRQQGDDRVFQCGGGKAPEWVPVGRTGIRHSGTQNALFLLRSGGSRCGAWNAQHEMRIDHRTEKKITPLTAERAMAALFIRRPTISTWLQIFLAANDINITRKFYRRSRKTGKL